MSPRFEDLIKKCDKNNKHIPSFTSYRVSTCHCEVS